MPYQVKVPGAVVEQIAVLPKKIKKQVTKRIDSLADDPRLANSTTLQGHPDLRKIRSGDYRIVYKIRDKELLVILVKVGHRRDVYRGL